ncbi:TRAF3-interacting protein 1-like [Orbicella faveolata]|uniref:TRAF3-interacting protein 1-like n=1 Tax=Orbicella faveolata TaxID=48498 RepID=UPI0009E27632|nr:TRAF3-interacting protein 1-like [Orbicella faveolata]
MNTAIAKKTQETLGKVIKKPPLTEKLLSKPPFRFLHDIITEVVKNTGFLKGLYTADEMDSAKVKEKEAKILFLQKAIDVVGMINGQLSVRPLKIVAGHEPEKTNEFLQAIGMAVLSQKSSTDAVKKVLAGEKPGKEPRNETGSGCGNKDRQILDTYFFILLFFRIGSGKQVASVIVDDGKDQDDEDDTFVVEDPNAIQSDVDLAPAGEVAEDDGEHGGLVRKILETKKELEGGGNQEARPKQERQAPIISDAARRKERELAQKEIEKLRTSIQTLTRSANPLGKIMDYIQEDMDSMQKELDIWRRENKEHEIALRREESITESEIAPLKSQLEELDTEITEMVDRISTVKCNILRNDEKIQKMLSSVSLTSR